MSARKTLVALAIGAALGMLGVAAAVAGNEKPDREDRGGAVTPCSLAGVNPAYHPEIFGNPAAAKSFGFVRSRDGTWQVEGNCSRSPAEPKR